MRSASRAATISEACLPPVLQRFRHRVAGEVVALDQGFLKREHPNDGVHGDSTSPGRQCIPGASSPSSPKQGVALRRFIRSSLAGSEIYELRYASTVTARSPTLHLMGFSSAPDRPGAAGSAGRGAGDASRMCALVARWVSLCRLPARCAWPTPVVRPAALGSACVPSRPSFAQNRDCPPTLHRIIGEIGFESAAGTGFSPWAVEHLPDGKHPGEVSNQSGNCAVISTRATHENLRKSGSASCCRRIVRLGS